MLEAAKKRLWSGLCSVWALIVALFWFAMRVIWSGISKVLAGGNEPSSFILNLPLYVSILLWIVLALAIANLVFLNHKRWPKITLTALLGVFTIASAVVVIEGAVDYLYFIIPKFLLSLLVSVCIVAFAVLVLFNPIRNCKVGIGIKCGLIALCIVVCIFL